MTSLLVLTIVVHSVLDQWSHHLSSCGLHHAARTFQVNQTDSASCDGVPLSFLDVVPHVPGCTGSPSERYVAQVIAAFLLLILFTLTFPVYSAVNTLG